MPLVAILIQLPVSIAADKKRLAVRFFLKQKQQLFLVRINLPWWNRNASDEVFGGIKNQTSTKIYKPYKIPISFI